MQQIFPFIYQIFPSKETPSKYRSFFIKRSEGNLLIPCFSNSSTIERHFDTISAMGGLDRQLLGDSHFKSAHNDTLAQHFNAPLFCSKVEAPNVTPKLKHVTVFPFTRHVLVNNVEIIPTPGHRIGGVCYLITIETRRYLFVGDFIWHDGEKWIPTPTKASGHIYQKSLELLESLEFDVLLSNSILSNPNYFAELDADHRASFFADLNAQLKG